MFMREEIVDMFEIRNLKVRDKAKRLFKKFEEITEKNGLKLDIKEFSSPTVRYAVTKWNKTNPVKLAQKQYQKTFVYVFLQ